MYKVLPVAASGPQRPSVASPVELQGHARAMARVWFLTVLLLASSQAVLAQEEQQQVEKLRLQGGQHSAQGTLEVKVGGIWGRVCDDGFGFDEADAACRELGYETALRYSRNNGFRKTDGGEVVAWMDCQKGDDFRNCSTTGGNTNCDPSEFAGVECRQAGYDTCDPDEFACPRRDGTKQCIPRRWVCDEDDDCDDASDEGPELCSDVGPVRWVRRTVQVEGAREDWLVGGSVEVKVGETYGPVCHTDVTANTAKVLCRVLGYTGGWAVPYYASYNGENYTPNRLSNPGCTGEEEWLGECPRIGAETPKCTSIAKQDLGLMCSREGVAVRVEGGRPDLGGRVEVNLGGGGWRPVCGVGFDDLDAKVMCRMLGYEGDAKAEVTPRSRSTKSSSNLILDCQGSEQHLQECRVLFHEGACPTIATITCSRTSGFVAKASRSLLPQECGEVQDSSTSLIGALGKVRGGSISSVYDHPWLVTFRKKDELSDGGNLVCGGNILSEDWVITAAHCTPGLGRLSHIVRLGDFNSRYDEGRFDQEYDIEQIIAHERYKEFGTFDNDVALVKIKRKGGRGIRFNARVRPICLPHPDDSYDSLTGCQMAGWGRINRTRFSSRVTYVPRFADAVITDGFRCEAEDELGGSSEFTSSQICVGGPTVSSVSPCQGDSGSGMYCKVDGKMTLYGMVSQGLLCDNVRSIDKLSRLTKYVRWIQEKIATN